jgi:exodeoxyribonuclease VII small subunit
MMDKGMADLSFEALMAKLKQTLEVLEKGELSLEESMKSYETGIALVRSAEEKLKRMEGRMEQIMADGTISDLKLMVTENEEHGQA